MKNVSPALLALLNTRQFYRVTLYTIAMIDGSTLRYCSGDATVKANGNTYLSGGATGPYFELDGSRGAGHWKAGLEVDSFSFGVVPGTATVNGVSFFNAIKRGFFDGAEVTVERAYMPTYGDTAAGTIIIFNGRMVEINPAGAGKFTVNLDSYLELLNMGWPRNLFQANCVNTLGDTACGVNLAALAVTSQVVGATVGSIDAVLGASSGYFSFGKVKMTTGVNAGLSRGIRTYARGNPNSTVTLLTPFPVAPAVGDQFLIYPGCDKSIGICNGRFANLNNFRGTPFIPENSSAV